MKFIHYIEKISGVDIYGMTSLLIFVVFFLGILVWVLRTNKKQFNEVSRIPLDE